MVDAKRRLGMKDTKVRCGCAMRCVFFDKHGRHRNMRIHHKDCAYFRPRDYYPCSRNYTSEA